MVLCSSRGGPTSAVGKFPADYISHAGRKIGHCVDFFEEPAASDRAGGDQRVRRMWRLREEQLVEPETGKVGGGGGVLARKEVGVDCAG
jgi:hypothetical protein